MGFEIKKMFSASWKKAAKYAATWGVIVGAMTLIMNAIQILAVTMVLAVILIGLSLIVPIAIGYLSTRAYAAKSAIAMGAGATNGAVSGAVYSIVMIIIALIFIVINYGVAVLFGITWGIEYAVETLIEGVIVVVLTIILGIPILGIVSAIAGAIGGAAYSMLKK
ncbi:MAG: hypothetical protein ABID38_04250 [Candidatus Diapherotrites archaeon]